MDGEIRLTSPSHRRRVEYRSTITDPPRPDHSTYHKQTPPPTVAATEEEAQFTTAGAKDQAGTMSTASAPTTGGLGSIIPPAGSILSPQPKSETAETAAGLGMSPTGTSMAGAGPQVLDLVVTYAGDASKVGALEQALMELVKGHGTCCLLLGKEGSVVSDPVVLTYLTNLHRTITTNPKKTASSFKVGTPQAKPSTRGRRQLLLPKQRREAQITAAAADRCADPSVPKLDIPFRITAPDASSAAVVVAAFQQAATAPTGAGGSTTKQLTRGGDVFDASVLCGVAYAPAPASGPSAVLSPAAVASLQELMPVAVAAAASAKETEVVEEEPTIEKPSLPPYKSVEPATKPEAAQTTSAAGGDGAGGSSGGAIGGAIAGVLLVACAAGGFAFMRRRRLAAAGGSAAAAGGSQV